MQVFVDSSNPVEIQEACSWGLIDGVTTNPSLIAAAGPDKERTLTRILEVSPGPVLVQAIGWHDPKPLVAQACFLHGLSDRIIVKLPMSQAGIQALYQLKQNRPGIKLAVTAVASISQAYLCGKMGADIVALFNGPFDLSSDTPVELVAPVRKVYDNYGFKTQILSCGRFPRHFAEFAENGSDICTLKLEFMKLLYVHPYTDQRMTGFLNDWQRVFGEAIWTE